MLTSLNRKSWIVASALGAAVGSPLAPGALLTALSVSALAAPGAHAQGPRIVQVTIASLQSNCNSAARGCQFRVLDDQGRVLYNWTNAVSGSSVSPSFGVTEGRTYRFQIRHAAYGNNGNRVDGARSIRVVGNNRRFQVCLGHFD